MTTEEKQKLNTKIAKWLGWKYFENDEQCNRWLEPNGDKALVGHWHLNHPYFTESMDACLKWIAPKLLSYEIVFSVGKEPIVYVTQEGKISTRDTNESPSLAFCLSIEQLIDSEGK